MAKFYKFFSMKRSSSEKRLTFFCNDWLDPLPPPDFLNEELSLSFVPCLLVAFAPFVRSFCFRHLSLFPSPSLLRLLFSLCLVLSSCLAVPLCLALLCLLLSGPCFCCLLVPLPLLSATPQSTRWIPRCSKLTVRGSELYSFVSIWRTFWEGCCP